jgi:hypothetical protein
MRLNSQAHKLLLTEINKQSKRQNLDVQRDIVVKRLQKLSIQQEKPLVEAELTHLITDMFPDFDQKILQKAAKLNQKDGKFAKIATLGGVVAVGLLGLSGFIWFVNLPYPMIRRPVAGIAPMLLLPSYLSMDRNYREAIAHVEQADQLVNKATSAADIGLGAEKVKLAQQNLDKLPVWFLGYEPVRMCHFMGCSWNFTFDEFSRAREKIGRMDARIFQENNAFTQLQTAETDLQKAKQAHKIAQPNTPQRQNAIADWQTALDQLTVLPKDTLAGTIGETKYRNYERDFNQVVRSVAGSDQTQTMIAAAQQFADLATKNSQKSAYTVTEWQQIETLWSNAINRLEKVDAEDPDYVAAQSHLADYTQKLGVVTTRLEAEEKSSLAIAEAKRQTQDLISSLPTKPNPDERNRLISRLQGIIDQLKQVQPNTTVYPEAQTLLKQAQSKLSQL